MTGLPLEEILVVAAEQAVAGPFATRQLADLGARVVKIERPEGDFARSYDRAVHGQSSHFIWLNRGKQSVVLDLKTGAGGGAMAALLDRADVFVQNLAPASAARLRLTAADVTRTRPRLIACDISGYGTGGPYSERKAYDLLIQCEAGLVSITGGREEPAKAGIAIADIAAGMYAYSGILAALYQRRETGRGQVLEVSMLEALGEWMGFPYLYARYGGAEPPRTGAHHATIAPYGPVRAGTGETIVIGIQNDREWGSFCRQVVSRPDLAADERFADNSGRVAHRAELDAELAAAFAELSFDAARSALDAAGIAWARQRTMAEFADHPQLAARGRWRGAATPGGEVAALVPPVTADGWQPPMGPVPSLGEHTEEVLRWLSGS